MNNKEKLKILLTCLIAVAGSQIVQGLLFFGALMILQKRSDIPFPQLLFALPGFLAVLLGGVFVGRLLSGRRHAIWIASALFNTFWPVLYQIFGEAETSAYMREPAVWMTWAGNIAIWYVGAWLGDLWQSRKPDAILDDKLYRYTGIVIAGIVALNVVSWASIHFSQGYRLAKEVELRLPADVKETEGDPGDPWIAKYRRFETKINPYDVSLYEYYDKLFTAPFFDNVTSKFQKTVPGQWRDYQDDTGDVYTHLKILSGRWRDMSGKVLVSLVIQADREDPDQPWDVSPWIVRGIVYTRSYAEPPPEPSPAVAAEATMGSASGETPTAGTAVPNVSSEMMGDEGSQEGEEVTTPSGSVLL